MVKMLKKKIKLNKFGQISIELMMLIAASFLALTIILPAIIEVNSKFISFVENKNIENFSKNLENEIGFFMFLDNDSKKEIEFNAFNLLIKSENEKLYLENKTKKFIIKFPNKINLIQQEYNQKINFILFKKNNQIDFEIKNIE
ncbi:MAG: hypothetical protein PHQ98_00645 [Candidatus ainarchaeum sp.]|nr:hypothetical protein [Candidatus ainarchaeum sp.]